MKKIPTEKTSGDVVRELGRAGVSVVPVIGGPLQVLFENVFAAPLEKRKEAWLCSLAEIVDTIQSRVEGLTPEKLSQHEAFITTALQATQIAIRNHQQEKLQALRAAVLNTALPGAPDENDQAIFLHLIDQLTPWHLRLLALLDGPEKWMQKQGVRNPGWGSGGVSTVIEYCIPALRGFRDNYDQIVRDLQAGGLIAQGQYIHLTMTASGMLESRTTERGKQFIRFISTP